MPEISGWEVASAIKKKDSSTVVVMVTGSGLEINSENIKESKVDFAIPKPFQIHQLMDSVAHAMEIKANLQLKQEALHI